MPSSAHTAIVLPSSMSRYFISPIEPYRHYNSTSPYPHKLNKNFYYPAPPTTPAKSEIDSNASSFEEKDGSSATLFSPAPSSTNTSMTKVSSISAGEFEQQQGLYLERVLYYNSRPVRNYMREVMQTDRFDEMLFDGFPALCERHLAKRYNRSILPCRCGQRQMTLRFTLTPIRCRAADAEIYGNRPVRVDSLPTHPPTSIASPRSSSSSTPLLSKRQRM